MGSASESQVGDEALENGLRAVFMPLPLRDRHGTVEDLLPVVVTEDQRLVNRMEHSQIDPFLDDAEPLLRGCVDLGSQGGWLATRFSA